MQELSCLVRDGLWDVLQRRSKETDEPVSHIVNRALADYLGFDAHTIFQVSTSTALVEGIYQGVVRVGTLREHGDLGLGTFENLDGEMVIVGGHVYQARCDGSVQEVGDDVLSPFAAVTRFSPEMPVDLEPCPNFDSLLAQLDRLRDSENMFYSIRIDGHFETMHTRAVCKAEKGFRLVNAAAVQPEFRFSDVSGTLVGFWTPTYARNLSIPGYHLHFLSADHTQGGHVLGCAGSSLRLQLQRDCNVQIALPETEDFLNGDMRRDPGADLAKAEGFKK
jgi:acetolactate decarboxylase